MKTLDRRMRGRPKDDGKRAALLDAAQELFLSRGLDVTTEEIASLAKVAKATLYANFTDKDALVEAVIRRESDLTITDEEFDKSRSMPVATALEAFGIRYLKLINHRDLLGWDRLIASAASRQPELPRRFFAAGPGRGQRMLAAIIAAGVARGELNAPDPGVAADELAGLWFGFVNLEIKLGARAPLSPDEIEARVSRGLQIFMKFYGKLE